MEIDEQEPLKVRLFHKTNEDNINLTVHPANKIKAIKNFLDTI